MDGHGEIVKIWIVLERCQKKALSWRPNLINEHEVSASLLRSPFPPLRCTRHHHKCVAISDYPLHSVASTHLFSFLDTLILPTLIRAQHKLHHTSRFSLPCVIRRPHTACKVLSCHVMWKTRARIFHANAMSTYDVELEVGLDGCTTLYKKTISIMPCRYPWFIKFLSRPCSLSLSPLFFPPFCKSPISRTLN